MNELIAKIEQWAEDRNIIKGSKPIDQAMKLFSEFGELADNVGKGRDCRDDIGDCAVVLIIIAAQLDHTIAEINLGKINYPYGDKYAVSELCSQLYEVVCHAKNGFIDHNAVTSSLEFLQCIANNNGYTLKECVTIAYNDIKDRKGLMHNGVFIKESDPAYASVVAAIESNCDIEEDEELNAIADSRKGQKRISVNIEDL